MTRDGAKKIMNQLVGLSAGCIGTGMPEDKSNYLAWRDMLVDAHRNVKRGTTDFTLFTPTALWLVAVRLPSPFCGATAIAPPLQSPTLAPYFAFGSLRFAE